MNDLIKRHVDNNLRLVALSPAGLLSAQRDLSEFLRNKQAQLSEDLQLMREAQRIATEACMDAKKYQRQVRLLNKRMEYYSKLVMALEQGYCVVPNLPMDVFAVRTDKKAPNKSGSYQSALTETPKMLPQGEGQYVSPNVMYESESYTDDKDRKHTDYWATDFCAPDFPFSVVMPEVLDATRIAMVAKLFDQIGVVRDWGAMRGDPMVVGQILDPRGGSKAMSFIIAWWLHTDSL